MQTTALMQQYIGTVNRAIHHNRDTFPYKQLIDATRSIAADGLEMQIAVYGDDPKNPHDYFTVKWNGSELEMGEHGKNDDVDVAWKAPSDHLTEVVNNPEPYVEQPAKLDLDWLGKRVGIA